MTEENQYSYILHPFFRPYPYYYFFSIYGIKTPSPITNEKKYSKLFDREWLFASAEDGFIFLTRNHVSLYGCVINSNAKARPPSQMQTTSSPPLCAFANQKRYKHLTRDTHIKYAFGCISFSLTSFRCNDSSAYWIYMNVENIFVVCFVSMARPPNPSRIRRSINKERQQI